ncbi:MAG: FAD-dependent oxidoreductase [Actinomycetota bacterium]
MSILPSDSHYDLIVIGGGSIGLSTAYHATKRGMKTLVLERYGFFNDDGSSAGASRQFRLQYAQRYMAELCLAAQSWWADLQSHTQSTLIGLSGSVWFGDPDVSSQEGGIAESERVMSALSIPYTKLDAEQIEQTYNFQNLPTHDRGFFQANGGIINLKVAEQAAYSAAAASGLAEFRAYEPVTGLSSDSAGISVSTASGTLTADRLAITSGAYTNQVVAHLGLQVPYFIWAMSSAYFRKTDPGTQCPTWFYFGKEKDYYGFPEVPWSYPGYIRCAPDFADKVISDPADRPAGPDPHNLALTSEFVARNMTGLDPTPQFPATCLIALSSDSTKELLLDYVPSSIPNNKRIVVYTAGWAAKLIPILGDMICEMLTSDVTDFTYNNFSVPQSNFSIGWRESSDKPDLSAVPVRRVRK